MTTLPGDARVLIVDDEEPIRRVLARLLEDAGYECEAVSDAESAMLELKRSAYALVLTDMDMPGPSGLDLIMKILARKEDTATVMITASDDVKLANTSLEVGAYGYVIKPFKPNEILINVSNALRRRDLEIENRHHRERLEQMVKHRTGELWDAIARLENVEKDLTQSREETVRRLAIAAEFRDDETASHILRMSHYCELLARNAGVGVERADLIRVASLLHDVGKIGIPDMVLQKPGRITTEERVIMQQHSAMGHRILAGSKSELLRVAAQIAWTHHERVDGSGYPLGLVAEAIPFEGRVAAIADVFDALTSDRSYKKAFPLDRALEIMGEGRDSHFDAKLLGVFLDSMDEVIEIKDRYSD